jgi:hypothetical protein
VTAVDRVRGAWPTPARSAAIATRALTTATSALITAMTTAITAAITAFNTAFNTADAKMRAHRCIGILPSAATHRRAL